MEGGELFHQIVKLTYFSESLARHVILQVAHGIRYLHEERGVVHRDIKPENLAMGVGNNAHRVYVLDLGLAKAYLSPDGSHIPYEGKEWVGTPRYASHNPHFFRGK